MQNRCREVRKEGFEDPKLGGLIEKHDYSMGDQIRTGCEDNAIIQV